MRWMLVTGLGLVVEVAAIVVLGRLACRRFEGPSGGEAVPDGSSGGEPVAVAGQPQLGRPSYS